MLSEPHNNEPGCCYCRVGVCRITGVGCADCKGLGVSNEEGRATSVRRPVDMMNLTSRAASPGSARAGLLPDFRLRPGSVARLGGTDDGQQRLRRHAGEGRVARVVEDSRRSVAEPELAGGRSCRKEVARAADVDRVRGERNSARSDTRTASVVAVAGRKAPG